MNTRLLIEEWVKANRCSGPWTALLWVYLMEHEIAADDAVLAIEQFVNDIILAKTAERIK